MRRQVDGGADPIEVEVAEVAEHGRSAPLASKRTVVLIATTQGPVQVQRIAVEDGAQLSVMCIDGQVHETRVSRDYHRFVTRGTGIIEKRIGPGPYRLDVSKEIDAGSSWQLGAFIAHQLHHDGLLASAFDEGNAPEHVLWCTGAVRPADGRVDRVEAVADKLRLSLDRLQGYRADGLSVDVLVPVQNVQDVPLSLRATLKRAGIRIAAATSVDVIEQRATAWRWSFTETRKVVLGLAALSGVVAIGLAGVTMWARPPHIFDPLGIGGKPWGGKKVWLQPSFRCDEYLAPRPLRTSDGRTPTSDLLCSNAELADADREMGEARKALAGALPTIELRSEFTAEQRRWYGVRDRACNISWETIQHLANPGCLTIETKARQNELLRRLHALPFAERKP